MTVTATTPVSGPHIADGVNRDWQFSFKVDNVAHMALRITDADGENEQIILSGFTIADNYINNNAGGFVHYPVSPVDAIAVGMIVYPYRIVPYEQPTRIGNQGGFFPATHERAFDFLEMQIQQVKEITDRAVLAPVGEPGMALPLPESDLVIGWNAAGTALENKALVDAVEALPAVASTMLLRNAANTAFQAVAAGVTGLALLATATAGEAATALNVKALNADGGFTFDLTAPPTNFLGPLFGSTNRTQQRFVSDTDATHSIDAGDGADTAWYAVSIVSNFRGSGGASGGNRVDGTVWTDAQKKGWTPGSAPAHAIGSGVRGPVTTNMSRAINNEFGDTALYSGSSNKIMVTNVPADGTGNNLIAEWATRSYDVDGVTFLLDLHVFLGWHQVNLAASLHPGKSSGVNIRPHVGNPFAAFLASAPAGGGAFDYFAFATSDDTQANAYFAVTGNNNAAGGGLVRAANGSSTAPAFSFLSDPDLGFYREGANVIGWCDSGVKRGFFGAGFRVGIPTGGDPGSGSINIAGAFQVNGSAVINSAGNVIHKAATAAALADAGNVINTTGKTQGVVVYNTDDQLLYTANASGATAGWFPSDGGVAITPA